jgi:hypothetical protein
VYPLEAWHDFFVLVGTAGVTLTGLLFVVISLRPRVSVERQATGVRTFISPNTVYFTTALVVSTVFLVPALPETFLGAFICVGAAGSLGYLAYTNVHQRWRQSNLPFMDWVWYVGLPIANYALLLLSGIGILMQASLAMHGVAAAMIFLLVIGIRNAWDLVIWISQQEPK